MMVKILAAFALEKRMSRTVELMQAKVDAARSGDGSGAAMAAMLIHLFPEEVRPLGLNSEYNHFLQQAVRAHDAELLICLGEALFSGRKLARNANLGLRCFLRANQFSDFMGAFMLSRTEAIANSRAVLKWLKKASRAGHIPSSLALGAYIERRLGWLGFLYRPVYAINLAIAVSRALKANDRLEIKFWRYKDTALRKSAQISSKISVDRLYPFLEVDALLTTDVQ